MDNSGDLEKVELSVGQVEVDRDKFTLNKHDPHKDGVEVISFIVPKTIEKARSAFCYDPVFNMAVEQFASENNLRPEEALSKNLMKKLSCRAEVLEDKQGKTQYGTSVTNLEGLVREVEKKTEEKEEEEKETINSLKSKYVNGDFDIYEFEDRIEELLENSK